MLLKELYSNSVPLFIPSADMYIRWADEGYNILMQRVRRPLHTHARTRKHARMHVPIPVRTLVHAHTNMHTSTQVNWPDLPDAKNSTEPSPVSSAREDMR